MRMFIANIFLAFIWALMTEGFTLGQLAIGFVASYFLLLFLKPLVGGSAYFLKVWQVLSFGTFFIKELIVANLRIAYHVITPASFFKPAVVAVPLEEMNDLEATLLANVITLTPGSFAVDISTDRKVLYVHVMDVDEDPDVTRRQLKEQYEKPLLEVLR